MSKFSWGKFATIALLAALLGVGIHLRVVLFGVSVSHLPTNTDEALNVLMARDIAQGSRPILFWTQPYQFPIEAYLLSPFVEHLPADAFGARSVLALMSCVSLAGFLLIFRYSAALKESWPAVALVLIPSSYVLTRQVAFLIPQYASTVTIAWLLPLLFVLGRAKGSEHLWAIPIGFFAGLGLSIHLLSLAGVACVCIAVCWGTSLRAAIRNTAFLLPSFLLGLSPYLLAMTLPNAYEKVADTISLAEALPRLWSVIIANILPVTMGISECIFPDMGSRGGTFGILVRSFSYFFLVVLVATSFARLTRIVSLVRARTWPALDLEDIVIGSTWASLILAALAGFGVKYRYLLPVAWYSPFLFASLYLLSKKLSWRIMVSFMIAGMTVVNFISSTEVIERWSKPGFASQVPKIPDASLLLGYLESEGITRCYGLWWPVYRIPYESNNRVICSQPFNERFPGWPLSPLLAPVDASPETVYVVQKSDRGAYKESTFENLLDHQSLQAERADVGDFVVFRNFRHKSAIRLRTVSNSLVKVSSSERGGEDRNLIDRDIETGWGDRTVSGATWIELALDSPQKIGLIRLYANAKQSLRDVTVSVLENGTWRDVLSKNRGLMLRVRLGEGSPFPGHSQTELTFGFPAKLVNAIRISPAGSLRNERWSLREVELLAAD